MSIWEQSLQRSLEQQKRQHQYRRHRILNSTQTPHVTVNGRKMLNFCSNDYLGLAADPRIADSFKQGIERWGSGSGSAHLVSGHSEAHEYLQKALAEFTGRERALLFSSGYMANLAVLTALPERGDTVIQDKLDHASLIDGAQLGVGSLLRYPHNDLTLARQRLEQAQGKALLAVDGVFSMDGDLAPLPELSALCQQHQAWLMVDDAHGLGVLGDSGGGSVQHWGLDQQQAPILMGTLGKAFGTAGAFVAGSELLIETLVQKARSYIFTTALPAALAEATMKSLVLVREEHWRRQRLRELVSAFRKEAEYLELPLLPSATPIQPLLAGSAETALEWSRKLEDMGILVAAIRPPAVPQGQSRLRITFSATHTDNDLEQLLGALERL